MLAKLDESSAAPPEPASAPLPERSAWKSPCRELRELREWGWYTVSTAIPSIPSVGADEAAAPWGVLLCTADLGWDGMGEGLRTAEEAPLLPQ